MERKKRDFNISICTSIPQGIYPTLQVRVYAFKFQEPYIAMPLGDWKFDYTIVIRTYVALTDYAFIFTVRKKTAGEWRPWPKIGGGNPAHLCSD